MKEIEISGYNLAIAIVGQSLHITAKIDKCKEISKEGFNANNQVNVKIYNEFTAQFKRLPEDFTVIKRKVYQNQLIIILK